MKPPTSAQSAERSSRASRRRPTTNRHNLLTMKNQMKNHPVVVGPKVLLGDQADRLGRLVDLPVNQADHLEGAEHGEPRKAWIELGKVWSEPGRAWSEPRKAQRQRKSEHSEQKRGRGKDKRVGN